MPKIAMVAALEREVSGLIKNCTRAPRDYDGRNFMFFEKDEMVIVCGGIGLEAARRAAEAVIALYHPALVLSVGFAGALHPALQVGDVFSPAVVLDARDGSRFEIDGGKGLLVTFMAVAGSKQKAHLAEAYNAQAVDMEAAAVATAARVHGVQFAATKVVSDGLDFDMPETTTFIGPEGQFRTASFAFFVALRPWLWRRVAILARNSNKAARILAGHLKAFSEHPSDVIEAKVT
jgi:adenosylhomocysteine nucleosidase